MKRSREPLLETVGRPKDQDQALPTRVNGLNGLNGVEKGIMHPLLSLQEQGTR